MTESEAWEVMMEALAECRDDPVAFNDLFLDRDSYWSRQAEIVRSLVQYKVTVAYTGNMTGKDFAVGGIVPWWLTTRPDSLVIITGPSQTVLGSVTFKEIRRALEGAILPWGGRVSQTIKASPALCEVAPGWQALGFSTTGVERASGQHAGQLLVIVEEASGVEDEIWDAIDSLGYERLLAIGNPIRAEGRFIDLIRQADRDRRDGVPDGEAVNAIQIPSTESPHATWDKSPVGLADRPWISGMIRKYGADSLWVRSHIHAEVPEVSAEQLIPPAWLDFLFAQTRDPETLYLHHPAFATRCISCDLGEGVGRDSSCVLVRDGWGVLDAEFGNQLGLSEAAGLIWEKSHRWQVPHNRISYDRLGIGRNMPLHLARHGITQAIGYAGDGTPRDRASFVNLRTEGGWMFRNRLDMQHAPDFRTPHVAQVPFCFAPGPYLDRLREELRPLTYSLVGNMTKLLNKEDWAAALGHSPDVADTILQSFACF